MFKLFHLAGLFVAFAAAAETVTLQPERLQRIAWEINWVDECRRIGGDAAFDGGPQRMVVQFDLGEVPDHFRLERAELRLQSMDPIIDDGILPLAVHAMNRPLARISRPLLEQPGMFSETPAASGDWAFSWDSPGVFDLTNLVASWLSGEKPNFGILLKSAGESAVPPDRDMYNLRSLELVLVGTVVPETTFELDSPAASPEPSPGTPAWRFPDGTRVADGDLPGKLISGNRGFWGNYQIPADVTVRLTRDGFCSDGTLGRNPRPCLDGDFSTAVTFTGNDAAPFLTWEFSEPATLNEVDVAVASSGIWELELFASDDGREWKSLRRFRQRSGAGKEFFRIGDFAPAKARYFGLANTGRMPVTLKEALLWGEAVSAPAPAQCGILPEMAGLARRELVVKWSDVPIDLERPGQTDFSRMTRVDFFELGGEMPPDPDSAAYLQMSPAGLEIVYACRKRPEAEEDSVGLFINRYDLEQRRYYEFRLDSNGKLTVNAEAVIDPTKGGVPFQPEVGVADAGEMYYAAMRLPLSAMAGDEGFEAHRWPVNLVRRFKIGEKEAISAYPQVPELHIPMLFTVLQSARTQKGGQVLPHSFPGVEETAFSTEQSDSWRKSLGPAANSSVVVFPAPFESEILNAPVLPPGAEANQSRRAVMSRGEVENLAWYVINPSADRSVEFEVGSPGFPAAAGLEAELGVVGVVQRRRGAMLRPIFLAGNLPSPETLRQYVRNAADIEGFPSLRLPPGGAALVTLRLRTSGTEPGEYESRVTFGDVEIPVTLSVLDVTPRRPEDYFYTVWGNPTRPAAVIAGSDYSNREACYWRDSGYNVVHAYPLDDNPGLNALKERIPDLKFLFVLSGKYMHLGYNGQLSGADYNDENRAEIIEELRKKRDELLAAGYGYDRWAVELWDEPGPGVGVTLMEKIVRTIKEFDPRVQIYCNPCCWGGNGFRSDREILDAFQSWYNETIDISFPIEGLYFGFGGRDMKALRVLWDAPRRYSGTYIHPCPGPNQLRRHFSAGLNAWGYYCYYAPRQNPWNDLDTGEMDYAVVYPGVTAPVITIESEQMREGFEEYCLANMLAERKSREDVARLLTGPTAQVREVLLKALAAPEKH